MLEDQIKQKYKDVQRFNELRTKSIIQLGELKLEYVKDTFRVDPKMIFKDGATTYSIEYIHMYLEFNPENIYLSCSKFLKSGRWSVKTSTITLEDYLLLKEKPLGG